MDFLISTFKKLDSSEIRERSNIILCLSNFKIHEFFEFRNFDLFFLKLFCNNNKK